MYWNLGKTRASLFRSVQVVWAIAAMATLKKEGFHFVSDYRAFGNQIKKVPNVTSK